MIATSSPNPRAGAYYGDPVLTDSIFALARPDEVLAKKIEAPGAVAFLGKKQTYLLVEGGAVLSQIASELDGEKITLEPTTQTLFIKDKTVWGSVLLSYAPGKDSVQAAQDVSKLLVHGFKADRRGIYHLSVTVKGTVWPAAKLGKGVPAEFKTTRAIAFYHPRDSSPPPDLGKLITVPLAVVVDVALTPVYVLGFVVLVIGAN